MNKETKQKLERIGVYVGYTIAFLTISLSVWVLLMIINNPYIIERGL